MSYSSPDIPPSPDEDEKLRSAMRVLFAKAYGNDVSPLKRQVAYRLLSRANDSQLTDILLGDFIRGSFAEAVLRHVFGDALDTMLIYLRSGDVEKVRELAASAPVDAEQLAALLGQDMRSIMSGNRIHIDRRDDRTPEATANLISGTGSGSVANTVHRVFSAEGEAREAGLSYLRELNSADAVPALLEILVGEPASVINLLDACDLLALVRDERAVVPLKQLAKAHDDAMVCGAALNAVIAIAGSHDGVIVGAVGAWYPINEGLAKRVLGWFGDVPENDTFLLAMMNRDGDERERLLAAIALCMSNEPDYAMPLLAFLNHEEDTENRRWRAVLQIERGNTALRITKLFADRLDDEVRKTAMQPPSPDTVKFIERLMMAMVYLGNDNAEGALRGVKSNMRVDARIQEAANKALVRLRDRKQSQ